MAVSSPIAVRMTTSKGLSVCVSAVTRCYGELTGVLLLSPEKTDDLLADLTVGDLDVVLGLTILLHEGEVVIVGDVELETPC